MPKLSKSVPKYRKHKASGQAIVTLGGKDIYLGPYGTDVSKIAYDDAIGKWLQDGRPPCWKKEGNDDVITVTELIAKYYEFAENYYRKNGASTGTAESFRPVLRIVRTHHGDKLVPEFGPSALRSVQQQLVLQELSRRYINDCTDRIRRMFKWGVSREVVPYETYAKLCTVSNLQKGRSEARDTDPIQPVSPATVEQTLPYLPKVVAAMVQVQRLSGARPGEICMLRPCDVDRSEEVWKFRPESHKTEHRGRERTIYFGPRAQGILLPYMDRQPTDFCFSPAESSAICREMRSKSRVTPLSCGNRPGSMKKSVPSRTAGEKYSNDSYRRSIHRACHKAGIGLWSPNQLRHAAATQIRKEFGLDAAQVALGHASADVTQIYAERDSELAIKVASTLG